MIMIMISYNVLQKRLLSQKYKKCSPGKYPLLLYEAVSILCISIRFDAIVYVQVYFCVHFYVQVDSCTPCLWTGLSLYSLFMYKFMYRFIPLLIVYVQVDSFIHCLCTSWSLYSLFMYRFILELIVYVQVDSFTHCLCAGLSLNSLFMYRFILEFIVYE